MTTKTADDFLDAIKRELGVSPDMVLRLSPRILADLLVMAGCLEKSRDRYLSGELEVPCSECQAAAWEECRTRPRDGTRLPAPHQVRRELAKRTWESRRKECGDGG